MNQRRLLRWYPRAWRERYGDELLEVIERSTEEGKIPLRMRFDVARNGIKQRFVDAGIAGDAPGRERIRGGALLILWTFGAVVIAGIGLQKYSEHWQDVTPVSWRWLAQVSFGFVEGWAAVGAVILVLAGIIAVPPLRRFLAEGGWRTIRRRFAIAAAMCATTFCALGGVVLWAHHLSSTGRNGGSHAYAFAALGFALLICATIGALTALVARAARVVELPPHILRLEGRLAIALAVTMGALAIATGVWWATLVRIAPWFFTSARSAEMRAALDPTMIVVVLLMLTGTAIAAIGARRVRQGLVRPD